jgi:hypothetical protein
MWELIAGVVFGKWLFGSDDDDSEDESSSSIESGYHIRLRYGFSERSEVRLLVRSSEPIDIHFMRDAEVANWLNSEKFLTYRTERKTKLLKTRFFVGRGGCSLLLVNKGKQTAVVTYGLWSRP